MFKLKATQPKISFAINKEMKGVVAEPYPAATKLPEWFKKLPADVHRETGSFPMGTVKRCMPVLDSLSAGYIMPFPVAVHVEAEAPDKVIMSWRTEPKWTVMSSHSREQVGFDSPGGFHKWHNPWTIKTPPGVSCLFVHPLNRPGMPFECFSGVVDTDSYHHEINFPFMWKEFPFDKVIDAGEPLIQVIPFKREDWVMDVSYVDEEEAREMENTGWRIHAVNHKYKKEDRVRKVWR